MGNHFGEKSRQSNRILKDEAISEFSKSFLKSECKNSDKINYDQVIKETMADENVIKRLDFLIGDLKKTKNLRNTILVDFLANYLPIELKNNIDKKENEDYSKLVDLIKDK